MRPLTTAGVATGNWLDRVISSAGVAGAGGGVEIGGSLGGGEGGVVGGVTGGAAGGGTAGPPPWNGVAFTVLASMTVLTDTDNNPCPPLLAPVTGSMPATVVAGTIVPQVGGSSGVPDMAVSRTMFGLSGAPSLLPQAAM